MRSPRSWIRRSSRLLLAVAVAQALLPPLVASPPPPLNDPQVLTIFKKEIPFFRERSIEHLGSVEIPRGWAQSWWLDAGGGRLAVLSKEGLLRSCFQCLEKAAEARKMVLASQRPQ